MPYPTKTPQQGGVQTTVQPPSGRNDRRKKLLLVIAIGLVGASASTFLFYHLISGGMAENTMLSPAEHLVVVAARDLSRGRQLTADDLEVASWKGAQPPGGAFFQASAVQGKVVGKHVSAGQPVLPEHLVDDDQLWLAAAIPSGMRAVTVHVQEFAGVTQLVQLGDRVDVMVANSLRVPGRRDLRLQTVLQNIEVVATGREPFAGGRPNPIPVVTLLVEARDSERLSVADQSSSIRLVLRNPLDESVEITGGPTQLSDVMRAQRKRRAASRPARPGPAPAGESSSSARAANAGQRAAALRDD